MVKNVNHCRRYALIDASAAPEVLEKVKSVIADYGQRIRSGYVLTPHGKDKVIFFEVKRKHCQIVDVLQQMASMYSLYPMYVIQEDKDHLPKTTKTTWYVVDEIKMALNKMDQNEFDLFVDDYVQTVKSIYRDDSVFVKSFVYLGKYGVPHIMSFNSERQPSYRGTMLGVPEWHDAMKKIEAKYEPEEIECMSVRYTNL